MIRQTGGTAVAATSTRSRLRCAASSRARVSGTTSWVPSTSISRTSRARICWLMRTVGVGSGLEMGHLLGLRDLGDRFLRFFEHAHRELVDRHGGQLLAASYTRSDLAIGHFTVADDEHVRDLLELGLADLVAELLVSVVELRTEPAATERRD